MRMRFLLMLAVAGALVAGCGGSNKTYKHTDAEEKAVQEAMNLTPEQQIERAQNAPLPPEQKEALIKSIKEKNGIK